MSEHRDTSSSVTAGRAAPSAATVAAMVAEAATATPGVASLDGGAVGEFATYGHGTRVSGVRIDGTPPTAVRLRLVVDLSAVLASGSVLRAPTVEGGPANPPGLESLTREVHQRVASALESVGLVGVDVALHVADVRTPDGPAEPPTHPGRGGGA